jgi:hypothetical protein
MNRVIKVSVAATVLLTGCVSAPVIDYTKIDAECGRICQKNEAECKTRYAELPTVLFTHCKPELNTCVKACPPPGTTPLTSPDTVTVNSDSATTKPSIADRLKLLNELHNSGVITDKEYSDKRQEILKSL